MAFGREGGKMKAMTSLLPIVVAMSFAGFVPAQALKPKAMAKPRMIPNTFLSDPLPGSKVYAWSADGSPVCATGDVGSADILAKALKNNDGEAIQRLKDSSTIFMLDSETPVRVTKSFFARGNNPGLVCTELLEGENKGSTAWMPMESVKSLIPQIVEIGSLARVGTGARGDRVVLVRSASEIKNIPDRDLRRGRANKIRAQATPGSVSAVVIDAEKTMSGDAVKIRLIDGADKGDEGWLRVERLTHVTSPVNQAPAANKTDLILKLARRFEEIGDKNAAVEYYRRLIKSNPESDESREAAMRIQDLGFRL